MIGLVACCKTKLDRAAPARELYRSPLFRLSLAYAERTCETVYVASALHGLVRLDAVIAPYEATLIGATRTYRAAWGELVLGALVERHGTNLPITFLVGRDYVAPIMLARHGLRVHVSARSPLAGLQIGQRLAFLKRAIAEAA